MSKAACWWSILYGLVLTLSACTGDALGPDQSAGDAPAASTLIATAPPSATGPAPFFEPGTGSLQALVGSTFSSGALPAGLQSRDPSPLGGALLLNTETNPADEATLVMHWIVQPDHANVTISKFSDRDDDGIVWEVMSVWHLTLESGMVLTVGTNVCAAPIDTFDWQNGAFLAVTNREQDRALGAWVMSEVGPTPYGELASLKCKRFVP